MDPYTVTFLDQNLNFSSRYCPVCNSFLSQPSAQRITPHGDTGKLTEIERVTELPNFRRFGRTLYPSKMSWTFGANAVSHLNHINTSCLRCHCLQYQTTLVCTFAAYFVTLQRLILFNHLDAPNGRRFLRE